MVHGSHTDAPTAVFNLNSNLTAEQDVSVDFRLLPYPSIRGGTSVIRRGEVRLASGARLPVVVKTIQHQDSQLTHEFITREVAVLRRARHRFIVPFIGTVDLQAGLGIVLPFMENGDLTQYLRANPGADRRLLVFQVADAVCYLHSSLRFVHGDLKCENVLVSDDGNARLTDFGTSTTIDKPASEATTGMDMRQHGTLRFSAPELLLVCARSVVDQVRSKTPATDVYAFAMLVLQAFTGRLPWPDYNCFQVAGTVLYRQIMHPRPGDEATLRGLDDQLWELCLKCWARDPASRPKMPEIRRILRASNGIVDSHEPPVLPSHSVPPPPF